MKLKQIMNKVLAPLLIVSMSAVPVSAIKFGDLQGYGWAEKYITDVSNKGIISGYPDATFKPGYSVTRIESLVMIANLYPKTDIDNIYKNSSAKYMSALNKYKIDDWAKPYVVFALEKGIIPNSEKMLNSLVDSSSRKHINAVRYEVCVFLVRGLGLEGEINKGAKLSYNDNKDIIDQAVPYIELLQRKGIISKLGDGSGNFFPKKAVTRAETAVMISNAYKYSAKAQAQSTQPPVQPTVPQTPVQEVISGKIDLLTFADNNMTVAITSSDNKVRNFTAPKKSVSVVAGDKIISINDLKVGQQVELTVNNSQLTKIAVAEETVRYSGKLVDYSIADKTITVSTEKTGIKLFKYTDASTVYVNDKLTKIEELPKNTIIDLYAQGDTLIKASMTVTKNEFSGEITDYTSNSITISEKGVSTKKELSKDVKIYRNDKRVDSISLIAIGDTAKITTDGDKVIEILVDAQNVKYMSAVIKGIEMNSYYNKIIIGDRDGNEHNLTVNNDTVIRINDVKTNIYSLKLGHEVDIYAKGAMVEEIVSRGDYKQTTVSGKVIEVDLVDKFVEIRTGNGDVVRLYYTNATKIEKLSGTLIEPRKIYKDDQVTAIGVYSGGNISATRIIVDID
ncbi:SLH domain protein [Peptoanaerobacter stomatis]|uniref:SLH domain protein n=1 Tax=Peptoanaerobacter stomatis TaxID=796937 RepID=J4WD90_9FIRM|nr:S-layer homology domain-containing protein [Peptoanaerobacter stomatis]EJU23421.1 SLH domain protein [Peptoanaerobacter stomatis]NWO24404.1 S-layer homology domain-containing protein [Peptostreptococcaceae bacterium oral taxon 081]